MGRFSLKMNLGRLGMKQRVKSKCSDGETICFESLVLGFDVVVDS